MKSTTIKTRKINKEVYTFILNTPDYIGEKGVCGIELTPYIEVKTPENCFGYPDTLLYSDTNDNLYTLHRSITPWIKKELLKTYKALEQKYLSMDAYIQYYNEINGGKKAWKKL